MRKIMLSVVVASTLAMSGCATGMFSSDYTDRVENGVIKNVQLLPVGVERSKYNVFGGGDENYVNGAKMQVRLDSDAVVQVVQENHDFMPGMRVKMHLQSNGKWKIIESR